MAKLIVDDREMDSFLKNAWKEQQKSQKKSSDAKKNTGKKKVKRK